MGLFKHGQMANPKYAIQVFAEHFNRVNFKRKKGGFVALELGPGDSLFSAIIACSCGATRCYMVDNGDFALKKRKSYESLVKLLKDNCNSIDFVGGDTVPKLVESCGGIYYTEGLQSLKGIPDGSIDFIWSHAVLEHIRYHEFEETLRELRRVLRPDGVCSHQVDLKDHLGGKVNNLRFGSRIWETDWMASSGFYTNRIRFKEMLAKFESAAFSVDVISTNLWPNVPISRRKLAKEFQTIDNEDLLISGFTVILKPIKDSGSSG